MANSSTSSSRNASVKPPKLALKSALPVSFYARDTLEVSRDLLGKVLLIRSRRGVTAGRIVETEAYRQDDPASHSFRGKTPRASIMFGNPGVAYVYFIYGMYEMLNFVTESHGTAGAVLIRALEPLAGEELMIKRRGARRTRELASGPGRLCRAMGVRMLHNGHGLRGPEIYVLDDGYRPEGILVSPRVGITQAREKLWRYWIAGSSFVSKAPQNAQAKPWRELK